MYIISGVFIFLVNNVYVGAWFILLTPVTRPFMDVQYRFDWFMIKKEIDVCYR